MSISSGCSIVLFIFLFVLAGIFHMGKKDWLKANMEKVFGGGGGSRVVFVYQTPHITVLNPWVGL